MKFTFAEIILGRLLVLSHIEILLLCRDYNNVSDERKIELSNSDVATEGTYYFCLRLTQFLCTGILT